MVSGSAAPEPLVQSVRFASTEPQSLSRALMNAWLESHTIVYRAFLSGERREAHSGPANGVTDSFFVHTQKPETLTSVCQSLEVRIIEKESILAFVLLWKHLIVNQKKLINNNNNFNLYIAPFKEPKVAAKEPKVADLRNCLLLRAISD